MVEGRGRNWKAKYLTKDEFEKFRTNEFCHFKRNTYALLISILIATLAAVSGFGTVILDNLLKHMQGG